MRTKLVLALLLGLASTLAVAPTHAEAPTPSAPSAGKPAPATAATGKPATGTKASPLLLYKLESTSATVYLLGSIHVASESLYPLDKRIDRAFEEADTLVLETELTPTAKARGARLMQDVGLYKAPDSLDAHLDAETRAALQAALEARGLPAAAVKMMRPWLLSLTLTVAQLDALGYRAELGIDEHFRARAARKHIASIETIEQQVALFRDMPEPAQLAALRESLAQLDQLGDTMSRAFEAWRSGDARKLDALLLEPMRKEYPALYERFFVARNRRMAEAVRGYLEGNGTVFVVVGSGHLVGPSSVLQFLAQQGVKAQQQ